MSRRERAPRRQPQHGSSADPRSPDRLPVIPSSNLPTVRQKRQRLPGGLMYSRDAAVEASRESLDGPCSGTTGRTQKSTCIRTRHPSAGTKYFQGTRGAQRPSAFGARSDTRRGGTEHPPDSFPMKSFHDPPQSFGTGIGDVSNCSYSPLLYVLECEILGGVHASFWQDP